MLKYAFTTKFWMSLCLLLGASIGLYSCLSTKQSAAKQAPARILVFSKTAGFKHASIPVGLAALQKLGQDNNFRVDTTKNAAYFTEDSLKNYQAVVFLSTTMNVLNDRQQVAFERYIQAGGGFAGIHAAADTEYDWPWYNKLVGAQFLSHPHNQTATIVVSDKSHPATAALPDKWTRLDEWYNYKSIYPNIKVLATLDETTYEGGQNGAKHPIIWHHEFDGGRAFYTGLGHTNESYSDPVFLGHVLGGIRYAMGEGKPLDYSKSYAVAAPEETRFVKTVLANDLNEPMELAVAPDGRVFYVQLRGRMEVFNPATRQATLVRDFPVVTKEGLGLLGITLDPDFASNNFLYVFYTPMPENPEYKKLLPLDYKADAKTIEVINANKVLKHYISRFTLKPDNTLDLASEKVLLQIPIELEASAHHGGSLAFDKDKNLIIATGDNTVPFQSNGHAPIDEIPGRIIYDAQRSSANTNDLRGKVLRIKPQADGSYTVPAGNLFPAGTANTRPEIYTMGLRNPYRMTTHPESGVVYWGEIGPDAGTDSPQQGPRGYDEINQAKKAGNFGWPYFIGDTKPYRDYDFAGKTAGAPFNPAAPANESPNNTGLKQLPAPQPAMIWYPYAPSNEFPELGQGGRSAMAGEFYRYAAAGSAGKLPEYYHNGLFVFDWMRNWVKVLRFDAQENYLRTEDFLPVTGDFRRPIDLAFGQDGVMYMLEYGSIYGIDNDDARLVKLEYNPGNRAPIARASVSDSIGLAPLKVSFSSKGSRDYDENDQVKYQWLFDGKTLGSTEANPTHTYAANGTYRAILKVSDRAGLSSQDTIEVKVGNAQPEVSLQLTGNQSFYWDDASLKYAVKVADKEDGKTDPRKVRVYFDYNPRPVRNTALLGHQILNSVETQALGKSLIAGSDCKACHTLDKVSVGPSFVAVAQRYKGDKGAVDRLAQKIIKGGGGNWGEHAMSAHPQVSVADAGEMVKYILSLTDAKKERTSLPVQGTVNFKDHQEKKERGQYTLLAAYTDKGGKSVGPLTASKLVVLRPARLRASEADQLHRITRNGNNLSPAGQGAFLMFKDIDLTGIRQLTYRLASENRSGTLEVRLDSPKGPVVSTLPFTATGAWDKRTEITADLQPTTGKHNLYIMPVKKELPNNELVSLDWIEFKR
ncbi:MAG: ThuA domain-containing protein [Adhaeribacter sp.]